MKYEIVQRINELGGDTSRVKGDSLMSDMKSITFSSVLYPKPTSAPWPDGSVLTQKAQEFLKENDELFEADNAGFYDALVRKFYQVTEEPLGQVFFKNETFTPFTKGSSDFEEWDGEWSEEDFRQVIVGDKMELMLIGYSYGYPDSLFICLSDPKPQNPVVYGTDHEAYFDEITVEYDFGGFWDSFITSTELVALLKEALE